MRYRAVLFREASEDTEEAELAAYEVGIDYAPHDACELGALLVDAARLDAAFFPVAVAYREALEELRASLDADGLDELREKVREAFRILEMVDEDEHKRLGGG